jgi:oxygen-independent coproporphyrinogen-3 oxidase
MDRVGRMIGAARPKVRQVHWGGGTPTWLSAGELARLQDAIAERFELTADREQSIEVDPRVTTPEQLAALRERGLNRVSMGVQDLDADVQGAIHRVQPLEVTARVIEQARALGIEGVNADLVYGLPHQTPAGFARTIDSVVSLGVDRVALYNFAYLPDRLNHHKAIRAEWLPSAATRVELFRVAAERFTAAGYVMIGLDHFAKATDELAAAAAGRTMQRNFMGYTTRAGSDLLAFGVSSISRVGRDFVQSVKSTDEYERCVDADAAPVERGMRLSDDDLHRESVIQSLMCYGRADFDRIDAGLLAGERVRRQLDDLAADGLVQWDDSSLRVTEAGRYFLRNIAMVFDAYLGRPPPVESPQDRPVQVRFSTTV